MLQPPRNFYRFPSYVPARYRPCFLSQKLGIAYAAADGQLPALCFCNRLNRYAAVDGSFLDCNSMFACNLGFPSAKEVPCPPPLHNPAPPALSCWIAAALAPRFFRCGDQHSFLQVIGLTIFNISTPEDGQQMSQLLHALVHCDPAAAPAPTSVPVVQHCVRPDNSLTPLLSLEISLLPRAPLPPVFMICIRPHQLPPDAKSSHPLPSISAHASSSAAAGGPGGQHLAQQMQMSLPQQQAAQASAALAHFAAAAGGGGLSSGMPLASRIRPLKLQPFVLFQLTRSSRQSFADVLRLYCGQPSGPLSIHTHHPLPNPFPPQLSNMESGAGFFNFDHLS